MIKSLFEFVKYLYVKLFNLILKVGMIPMAQCKGLITPVCKTLTITGQSVSKAVLVNFGQHNVAVINLAWSP